MAIHLLPQDVVNQIAAGEVIERPAHLVKELIENALDANATEIEIDVDQGGRFVCVSDNGVGIDQEDLGLALKRHATSKIETTFDLWALRSFGFRGEALASIAAVSVLTLTSCRQKTNKAYRIVSRFGESSDIVAVTRSHGTTVEVRDLFLNVPARLKFLKSDTSEVTHIKAMLKSLALENSGVQFRFKVNGKVIFLWLPQDAQSRVRSILEIDEVFEAQKSNDDIHVDVFLSAPHTNLSTSRGLWFFAQGRPIQDRMLQAAVLDAYRGLLMHGQYPYCVVKLKVSPEDIDVNIHPTKSQVKFLDSSKVYRLVQSTLRGVLEKAPWLKNRFESTPISRAPNEITQTFDLNELARTQFSQKTYPRSEAQNIILQTPVVPKKTWTSAQLIGQLRLTYIVAQTDQKLLLIDQHAAHERVAYEKLMRAWKEGQIDVQRFLIPLTMDFDRAPLEALIKHRLELERFGIEIELLSPTCLSIAAGPLLISESALVKGLSVLAQEAFEMGESFAMEKVISDVFATMACHSVVRAGQPLSFDQMHELLVSMEEFPLSSFCPHGRPVCVEKSFDEIEREFGRA